MKPRSSVTQTPQGAGPALPPSERNRPIPSPVIAFCEEAAREFDEGQDLTDITDRFFLHIEKNPQLLAGYRKLVDLVDELMLNAQIGRWIKEHFGLENGKVVDSRRSKLITAYTTHYRSGR